jgi:cytochrome bd-type quinol oxidase subunit 2
MTSFVFLIAALISIWVAVFSWRALRHRAGTSKRELVWAVAGLVVVAAIWTALLLSERKPEDALFRFAVLGAITIVLRALRPSRK